MLTDFWVLRLVAVVNVRLLVSRGVCVFHQ